MDTVFMIQKNPKGIQIKKPLVYWNSSIDQL